MPTIGVFLLKMFLVLMLWKVILNIVGDKKRMLDGFVLSWLSIYLLEILFMIILSAINSLRQTPLVILMCLSVVVVLVLEWKSRNGETGRRVRGFGGEHPREWFTLSIFFAFSVYLIVHSFFYYDVTPDALAYGMPRILLFAQKGLFTNLHSVSTNIFTNEWNGEINAVFYKVMTDDSQAIPFANIENWIYGIVCIYYCCKKVIKEEMLVRYTVLSLMFTPVVLFLSFVCKGDLLAIFLLPILCVSAYGVFVKEEVTDINMLLVLTSGSLCAGSKISMVPIVGLITILVFGNIIKDKNWRMLKYFPYAVAIYTIGCFRYILNLFYYGNFFQRVDAQNEKLSFSLSRLFESISMLMKDIVWNNDNVFTKDYIYALSANGGLAVVLLGILNVLIIFSHIKVFKTLNRRKVIFGSVIIFSLLFMLSTTMYLNWSFRYYAPYIWIILLFGIGLGYKTIEKKSISSNIYILSNALVAVISVFSSICLVLMPNEINGNGLTIGDMASKREVERQMACHLWLLENPEGNTDINDFYEKIKRDKTILICCSGDQIHSYIYGENGSNDIYYCYIEEFEEMYRKRKYDAILVSNEYKYDENILEEGGYVSYNPLYHNYLVWVKD